MDKKPSLKHTEIFGTTGHYLLPSADRGKLDDKSHPCIFLGVLPDGNGVSVLDTKTRKVVKTRDAVFHAIPPHSSLSPSDSHVPVSTTLPSSSTSGKRYNYNFWLDPTTAPQTKPVPAEVPDPPAPRRGVRVRNVPDCLGDLHAHVSLALSPSYKSAVQSIEKDLWMSAMKSEIDNLIRMKVFQLVPRPDGAKVITCRWHLKKKYKNNGKLDKFKARLVARGFTQREGLDFDQTFAPSSRQESLKAFLSIVGHDDWELMQLDVVAAFLYGSLDETIYMSQPEGFVDTENPDYVWCLNKSLYGLKQSARQWHLCFTTHLKRMGFTCSTSDPSIYLYQRNGVVIGGILIHVDDVLLGAQTVSLLETLNAQLQAEFQMSSSTDVHKFLSFDITRNRTARTFHICQKSYVLGLLQDFGLQDATPRKTPCNDHFKHLLKNTDSGLKTRHPYLKLLGCLQWLSVSTRPDISFAVNRLSQFNQLPTDEHWRAVCDVLFTSNILRT